MRLRIGVSFNDGTSYFVGHLPGRRQNCLYKERGGVITVLAFVKTEELADEIEEMLLKFSLNAAE